MLGVIGGDLIEKVRRAIGTAKYDDAVIVAYQPGDGGRTGVYFAISGVHYDASHNLIYVRIGREPVSHSAVKEGWRSDA